MSRDVDVLANIELPEPRGYRWLLNTGEVRFNDDPHDPPCDAYEEWSVCAALFDADQVREMINAAVRGQGK